MITVINILIGSWNSEHGSRKIPHRQFCSPSKAETYCRSLQTSSTQQSFYRSAKGRSTRKFEYTFPEGTHGKIEFYAWNPSATSGLYLCRWSVSRLSFEIEKRLSIFQVEVVSRFLFALLFAATLFYTDKKDRAGGSADRWKLVESSPILLMLCLAYTSGGHAYSRDRERDWDGERGWKTLGHCTSAKGFQCSCSAPMCGVCLCAIQEYRSGFQRV